MMNAADYKRSIAGMDQAHEIHDADTRARWQGCKAVVIISDDMPLSSPVLNRFHDNPKPLKDLRTWNPRTLLTAFIFCNISGTLLDALGRLDEGLARI